MITRIIVGLIMIAAGVLFIVKTEWWLSAFGRIGWAEEHLGSEGGTRIFYKLLGFICIILSFMVISGKLFTVFDLIFTR